MITDIQVRKLLKYLSQGQSLETASARSGMDEKTGRKYRNLNKLPSDIKAERGRSWRTRSDPLGDLWTTAISFLAHNGGLEAKRLFAYLQREHPGRISGGQLRTFQRRVKSWRATEGPDHEVFFPGRHKPGKMSRASLRNLSALQVRFAGRSFEHLIYHFVLTYSNWETGTILFTDDFASLCAGLQRSLLELGGVPECHRTDGFSLLARKDDNPAEFIRKYMALLEYYQLSEQIPKSLDVVVKSAAERRHRHFEEALAQALVLRGSSDFKDIQEYEGFLRKLFEQLNQGRLARLQVEQAVLRNLPLRKWQEERREEKLQAGNAKA